MEITLKNVSYRYKNKKLLERINLKIEDNHITGIIGEYKSLLCELIDSLKKPSTGSILVGALEINKENLKTVRKEVSLIRQNAYDQFFTDNVKEEMMFLISRLNYKPRDLNKKMNQALLLVGLDKSYLNKSIQSLSSGEKKLFQVAISLIYNPSIIIFDENEKNIPALASVNEKAINNKHFFKPILSKIIPHKKRPIPLDKEIILTTIAANPALTAKPSTNIGEQ